MRRSSARTSGTSTSRAPRATQADLDAERQTRARHLSVEPVDSYSEDDLSLNMGALLFLAALFVAVFCVVGGIGWAIAGEVNIVVLLVALLAGFLTLQGVHIAQQWERAVVLRLGKFSRVAGPGLFFTIPLVEQCAMKVDERVRTISFGAEETLTSDLVPVNVDAVLFWMVWDAKAACTEVGNFERAVSLAAQTTLRDAIGRASVNQVAIRRDQLDRELKAALEDKVSEWGISVLSVEVRDIVIPQELQDAMSLQAQAKQRADARMTLMETEDEICDMLVEQGEKYRGHDEALRLRAMHLLYESIRETGGTVVVPSSFSEGFGDILPEGATPGKPRGGVA